MFLHPIQIWTIAGAYTCEVLAAQHAAQAAFWEGFAQSAKPPVVGDQYERDTVHANVLHLRLKQ